MRRFYLSLCLGACLPVLAQLSFEAEECIVNRDACAKDKYSETTWNIWSTDKDAMKKWSGGVVIQSPRVMAERKSPEEGAPPLHLRITDVPKGTYNINVYGPGRVAAISLDGKTWKPFNGGSLAQGVMIDNGVFEFWFDDRYAMEKKEQRGSTYLDRIELNRVLGLEDGVANPGFEQVEGGQALGWSWWTREKGTGTAKAEKSPHSGAYAAHIVHHGEKDWNLSCGTYLTVKPEQEYAIRAWFKAKDTKSASVAVVGCKDGKPVRWSVGEARTSGTHDWKLAKGYVYIPGDVDSVYVRVVGSGATDLLVDDISLKPEKIVYEQKPLVKGWLKKRPVERFDRALVALPTPQGVYLSWRLLKEDPETVAFDVFREVAGRQTKLNQAPIMRTTDFLDQGAEAAEGTLYHVRPRSGKGPAGTASLATAGASGDALPYISIKLKDPKTNFMIAGVADLDGDGKLDYILKHPNKNIDPWSKYWYKSPETYKIEAYRHDGTYLWTHDLGWAIERGIWYSPWIAADLDGDGKAEIAAKTGEGDPRDEDGRVTSGPEYVSVWDGMTGKEIARAPWPSRDTFDSYNHASRNQIAMAYLDGKTPCLLALRGTYGRMIVDAYQLRKGKLEKLWHYDNKDFGRRFWGQGAHFTLCHDIDDDGRDEVILGSAVIDDNGVPLWTTGKGHPDGAYLADFDATKPGLEIGYAIETRNQSGGVSLVNARTGKFYWKLETPTRHVHGKGIYADINPTVRGLECYGADADGHKKTDRRWMYAADGTLLAEGKDSRSYGFGKKTGWWDADLQQELIGGRVSDFEGGVLNGRIEGSIKVAADILGDWREELLVAMPGELRIYSTVIPATDRRVCLMQDPVYRMCMMMNTMGYSQRLTLSYNLEATSPGLNLTFKAKNENPTCQVVVSAPLNKPVRGTLRLSADGKMGLEPASFAVDVKPGESLVKQVAITGQTESALSGMIHARLDLSNGSLLTGEVPVRVAGGFLKTGCIVEAETIASQTGGEVHIRTDKPGVRGKAISHWDDKGHAISWNVAVPKAGKYHLVVRYSTPKTTKRALSLNGADKGVVAFASTGGFGDSAYQWDHTQFGPYTLPAGKATIRLENTDEQGLNLDYLALVPVK
jgi:hypothetical protein